MRWSVCAAALTGLRLCCSQTPEDRFFSRRGPYTHTHTCARTNTSTISGKAASSISPHTKTNTKPGPITNPKIRRGQEKQRSSNNRGTTLEQTVAGDPGETNISICPNCLPTVKLLAIHRSCLGCSPQFRRNGPGENFKYKGVGLYVSL